MRSFAPGFYFNLIRLYDSLGIKYHPQPFLFSFANLTRTGSRTYFVHPSNNHQMPPPRPQGLSILRYLLEILFLIVSYVQWTLVAFTVPPNDNEPLSKYLDRTLIPSRFRDRYLLPLMASVSTCTHAQMLAAPASDVVAYKSYSHGAPHLAVADGISEVSSRLAKDVPIHFSAQVTDVGRANHGRVRVTWQDRTTKNRAESSAIFDHVILAVAPPVVASVFGPLRRAMASIPFTLVDSLVIRDDDQVAELSAAASTSGKRSAAQLIAFHSGNGHTTATHVTSSGALVLTRVADAPVEGPVGSSGTVLKTARFPRVLRTVESRMLVNSLFSCGPCPPEDTISEKRWHSGDDNVWLVGGWAWDGMVLLEGCVVSALRVARHLGVNAPWERQRPGRVHNDIHVE